MQRVVPSGSMELTFYLKTKPRIKQVGQADFQAHSMITGQLIQPYDVEVSDDLDLFSVTFQPHGAMRFFDLPLTELMNYSVALSELIGKEAEALEDEFYLACSFRERIRIAEKFILKRIIRQDKNVDYERIHHCIRQVNQFKGKIKIAHLADEVCLSRKQFERIFSHNIGTSPKQFLKIVRFQNAIFHKQQEPDLALTSLAYLCGYCDQPHMINDFKVLSGSTPSEFFGSCTPYSDYFSELS